MTCHQMSGSMSHFISQYNHLNIKKVSASLSPLIPWLSDDIGWCVSVPCVDVTLAPDCDYAVADSGVSGAAVCCCNNTACAKMLSGLKNIYARASLAKCLLTAINPKPPLLLSHYTLIKATPGLHFIGHWCYQNLVNQANVVELFFICMFRQAFFHRTQSCNKPYSLKD